MPASPSVLARLLAFSIVKKQAVEEHHILLLRHLLSTIITMPADKARDLCSHSLDRAINQKLSVLVSAVVKIHFDTESIIESRVSRACAAAGTVAAAAGGEVTVETLRGERLNQIKAGLNVIKRMCDHYDSSLQSEFDVSVKGLNHCAKLIFEDFDVAYFQDKIDSTALAEVIAGKKIEFVEKLTLLINSFLEVETFVVLQRCANTKSLELFAESGRIANTIYEAFETARHESRAIRLDAFFASTPVARRLQRPAPGTLDSLVDVSFGSPPAPPPPSRVGFGDGGAAAAVSGSAGGLISPHGFGSRRAAAVTVTPVRPALASGAGLASGAPTIGRAAQAASVTAIQAIADQQIDVNQLDEIGLSLLDHAIQALIERKKSLTEREPTGEPPLTVATDFTALSGESVGTRVATRGMDGESKVSDRESSARIDEWSIIGVLLACGAKLAREEHFNPLDRFDGNLLREFLLHKFPLFEGNTALHFAVANRYSEDICVLLELAENFHLLPQVLSAKNRNGEIPLDIITPETNETLWHLALQPPYETAMMDLSLLSRSLDRRIKVARMLSTAEFYCPAGAGGSALLLARDLYGVNNEYKTPFHIVLDNIENFLNRCVSAYQRTIVVNQSFRQIYSLLAADMAASIRRRVTPELEELQKLVTAIGTAAEALYRGGEFSIVVPLLRQRVPAIQERERRDRVSCCSPGGTSFTVILDGLTTVSPVLASRPTASEIRKLKSSFSYTDPLLTELHGFLPAYDFSRAKAKFNSYRAESRFTGELFSFDSQRNTPFMLAALMMKHYCMKCHEIVESMSNVNKAFNLLQTYLRTEQSHYSEDSANYLSLQEKLDCIQRAKQQVIGGNLTPTAALRDLSTSPVLAKHRKLFGWGSPISVRLAQVLAECLEDENDNYEAEVAALLGGGVTSLFSPGSKSEEASAAAKRSGVIPKALFGEGGGGGGGGRSGPSTSV
ncbi:MAG: hypothetical protein A3E87_10170 [Gammaproteobacteria bacterium RIFCSPHIGHO2_12_FULL_35_23]|nr:MAG: hypothetical protein A3E87_10170 [Gammaproteobacteria bacterium RIFCSPHIGHO2_12_FULL_35_23]